MTSTMTTDNDKRGEGKRTTASCCYLGGGDVGGATTTDDSGKGAGEGGAYESALAKLRGDMTDTALAILMAGIIVSHLRMHCHELQLRR